MIDTSRETLVSLTAAAELYPAVDGRRPHPSTIYHQTTTGVGGVRLESVRVAGRVVTSVEAVARFLANVNALAHTHGDSDSTDQCVEGGAR